MPAEIISLEEGETQDCFHWPIVRWRWRLTSTPGTGAPSLPFEVVIKTIQLHICVQGAQRREKKRHFEVELLEAFIAVPTTHGSDLWSFHQLWSRQVPVAFRFAWATTTTTQALSSGKQLCLWRSFATSSMPRASPMASLPGSSATWLGSWEPGHPFVTNAQYVSKTQKRLGGFVWTRWSSV